MEEKKTVWSLQNDVRTEEERNVFKPTGKQPKKKNNALYVIVFLLVIFAASFSLTFLQDTSKEICLTESYCFMSDDRLMYSFYIFGNIVIVVVAILIAYIIGKKIGERFKI